MSIKKKISFVLATVLVAVGGGAVVSHRAGMSEANPAGETTTTRAQSASRGQAPPGTIPATASALASPVAQPAALSRDGISPPRFVRANSPPSARAGFALPAATVRGSMKKEDVQAAIQAVIPAVKDCYEKLLERDPEAAGRLVVRFTIVEREGAGRISDATVIPEEAEQNPTELGSPLTEQCILNAVAEASFVAPAAGPVEVTYPLSFTPQ